MNFPETYKTPNRRVRHLRGLYVIWVLMLVPGCSFLFDNGEHLGDFESDASLANTNDAATGGDANRIDASIKPGCQGTLVDFESIREDQTRIDIHQGIKFESTWDSYLANRMWSNPSNAAAFHSNRSTGRFEFEQAEGRAVKTISFYRSSSNSGPVALTVSLDSGSIQTVRLTSEQPIKTLDLGSEVSRQVTITSDSGWRFFVDNICHEAP